MHRKSFFKIKIEFKKSNGSYIFDQNSQREYLDFFGLYATNVLGYNHPIFQSEEFIETLKDVASLKIPLNEIITDEGEAFLNRFSSISGATDFAHFHFTCTGALANEAAIKAAIDQKPTSKPVVLSLKESFHGINGYGGFVTDHFYPANLRLQGFIDLGWPKLTNPKIRYAHNKVDEDATEAGLLQFEQEFRDAIYRYGQENVAAIMIEPIQSTAGDFYFPDKFFPRVRELCNEYNVLWIQDEIQTGMGVTGEMWCYQHIPSCVPDIVTFGKKTQSGLMAQKPINKIFETPMRLEVTFDGDLVDMVRSHYVLKAYEQYGVLENVRTQSAHFSALLKECPSITNMRSKGLLFAFDLDSEQDRDLFVKKSFENGLLTSRAGEKSIRLRPNLVVTSEDIEKAAQIIKKSLC